MKTDTRQQIIEAAFSFYEQPRFTGFSLSAVAAKVGISKTAIFRHFSNKDALLLAMQESFFDVTAERLVTIQENEKRDTGIQSPLSNIPLIDFITFFSEHPYYIYYLFSCFSSSPDFESVFIRGLLKRGVKSSLISCRVPEDSGSLVITDSYLYIQSIYSSVLMLFFQQRRAKIVRSGLAVDPVGVFANKIVTFLLYGMQGCTSSENLNHPGSITKERMKELDSYCYLEDDCFPEEDRIFTALASVIKKNKFPGVTIERIAEELHMAKSSLYTYFTNKNELIRTLISKEIQSLMNCIRKNYHWAQNNAEFVYVHLRTEFNYFMKRPSVIPVCGWLRMSGSYPSVREKDPDGVKEKDWEKEFTSPITQPDLGVPISASVLANWVSVLPVTLILQGRNHGMTDDDLSMAINQVFTYIEYGTVVDNGRKNESEREW